MIWSRQSGDGTCNFSEALFVAVVAAEVAANAPGKHEAAKPVMAMAVRSVYKSTRR